MSQALTLVLPFTGEDPDVTLGLTALLAENLRVPGQNLGMAAVFRRPGNDEESTPRTRPLSVPSDPELVSALCPYLIVDGRRPDNVVTGELEPPTEEGLDGSLRLSLFSTDGELLHSVEGSLPWSEPVPTVTGLFTRLLDTGTDWMETPDTIGWLRLESVATAAAMMALPPETEEETRPRRYERALAVLSGALGAEEDQPFELALRKLISLCALPTKQSGLDGSAAASTLLQALERIEAVPRQAAAAALTLLQLGRGKEALELAERTVSRAPQAAGAWRALLETTESLRGTQAAAATALDNLTALRQAPEVLNEVGRLMQKLGRQVDAALYWEEAAHARPEMWQAPVNLGLLLRSMGKKQRSLRWFRYAVSHAADPSTARRLLAEELRKDNGDDKEELEKLYLGLVEDNPDDGWAMHGLAGLRLSDGALREAADLYDRVTRVSEGTRWAAEAERELFRLAEPEAWLSVDEAYRLCAEGDPRKGLTRMVGTLDGPETWVQRLGLAIACRRMERWEESREHLVDLLQIYPLHDGLLKEATGVLAEAGDLGGALRVARQAVTILPRDQQLHANLITALIGQSRLEEAERQLEQLERLAPQDQNVDRLRRAIRSRRGPPPPKPEPEASATPDGVPVATTDLVWWKRIHLALLRLLGLG